MAMPDNPALMNTMGMYALPYAAAQFPGLAAELRRIYADRVAAIPWLPGDWLAMVDRYHGKDVVLVPAPWNANGARPAWLDTHAKREWWTALSKAAHVAVQKYGQKMAADGAADLRRVYANAAFWENAYQIAKVLASPVTAVRSMYGLGIPWWGWLVGGLAVVYLLRRK